MCDLGDYRNGFGGQLGMWIVGSAFVLKEGSQDGVSGQGPVFGLVWWVVMVCFLSCEYRTIEYKDPLNDRVLSVATRHSIWCELQRGKENICFLFSGFFLLF